MICAPPWPPCRGPGSRGQVRRYPVALDHRTVSDLSERRDLRETAFRAWIARGANGGETDNAALISEIIALRAEKAGLLGYDSYAAYKLDDTMAKTPDAVEALLGDVWARAVERADDDRSRAGQADCRRGRQP
jgi:peptidyl-dipeptidase Dcp